MNLPDFMIIGVQRGGTSSMHSTLSTHPRLQPPLRHKEIHFFDNQYHRDVAWYVRQFPNRKKDCLIFESTPSYLYRPSVPQRVSRHLPEARFIIMLRNPVARAWSQWWHYRDLYGPATKVLFNHNSEPVRRGIYVDQLKRWFEYFPREHFYLMSSEQFFDAPLGMAEVVCRWLRVGPDRTMYAVKIDPLVHRRKHFGEYKQPPDKIAEWLAKYYAPYNKALESLLDTKFYW